MSIPKESSVLISGSNPVAFAFATVLSVCGIKVLVIDELKEADLRKDSFILDGYSLNLLEKIGYNLPISDNYSIKTSDFINQSLSLLATHLSLVFWDTQSTSDYHISGSNYILKHRNTAFEHQTAYHFTKKDLVIDVQNDALNFRNLFVLAWRVIGIINNNLDAKILQSYPTESEILSKQYANLTAKKTTFQKLFSRLLKPKKSEINLIDSKISLHLSQHRKVEAGELLLDLDFYDEKLKVNSSLYQWCSYHHFSVFFFGLLTPSHLFTIAKWIQLNYAVQLFYLPPGDKNQHIFEAFEIKKGERKTLIIRPDRYIGLINDAIDIDIIDNYLKSMVMMKNKNSIKPAKELKS